MEEVDRKELVMKVDTVSANQFKGQIQYLPIKACYKLRNLQDNILHIMYYHVYIGIND